MPDAAMDSSARYPPPQCHPRTRVRIRNKLENWLNDRERQFNMIWLHGPAGTGKSAIAQTLAGYCSDNNRLGAAFFFSRPSNRNKPDFVVPTLAYQLAVHSPKYKSVLTDRLANDPQLLKKAQHVQLKRLIVEPFLDLQTQERQRTREPFLIVLDGLDECEGERAQCEMVRTISEVAQLKNLPLLWLICSRPEAHLKHVFSRTRSCGREELLIDAECRDDVDRYLRDGFATIKAEYEDIAPSSWPSEDQFRELSAAVSGLFVLASTGLKYIGNSSYANPVDRLNILLSFLKRAGGVGLQNPLATLDLLYRLIIADVPDEIFPTTRRILSNYIYMPDTCGGLHSAQALCSFLRIDKSTFYSALWKLHSVIDVPVPENASETHLRFYHASFPDFLSDVNRSGKFVIEEKKAKVDIAKSCLFWHATDLLHFHTTDGESTTTPDCDDILNRP